MYADLLGFIGVLLALPLIIIAHMVVRLQLACGQTHFVSLCL